MKIAFVIHRYGVELVGGSEFHCRRIAEELSARHQVEVLTTTASDYITWQDGYAPGLETVNGVKVRRFRTERKRDLARFKDISDLCYYDKRHTRADELEWVRLNGPESPEPFSHRTVAAGSPDPGWHIYDPLKEFDRMGVLKSRRNAASPWR